MAKLLIIDSNRTIWKKLRTLYESSGHGVECVADRSQALKLLARDEFDLVLSDRRIVEANGYEFLGEVRHIVPDALIILTSEDDGFRQASDTLPEGVCDYITTLWTAEKIEQHIERALKLQRTRFRTHLLRDAGEDSLFLQSRSPAMRHLLENAERAAASNGTILLTGESGTGKTLLAQQMHLWSPRRAKPFVIVNCATLSQQRLEREILAQAVKALAMGAKRSPGPLEGAEGGTVFLEDVRDLSTALQLTLVRFVQERTLESPEGEKTVDVRIIAATSGDLLSDVVAHRFREDLFYSLNIISLRVPALRERPADILPLARRMLAAAAIRNRRSDLRISEEVAAAITCYRWPGNVLELRNAMEGATVLCEAGTITLAHLPEAVSTYARGVTRPSPSGPRLDQIEREHIVRVLASSPTLEDAAMTLGINVSTLWRKRKRYKLARITGSKV
jgi:two-component system, NtrC family, response regulator AlgB